MKKLLGTVALIIALTALAACGESKTNTPSALTVDTAAAADSKFVSTALEAAAGDVTVTFNNKGALPHNWTLVKAGDEEKASTDAMAAAPDYTYAGALAQTKTINGGTSQTVTVKLAAGTYSYLCTFPGHYALGMKGTLTVK